MPAIPEEVSGVPEREAEECRLEEAGEVRRGHGPTAVSAPPLGTPSGLIFHRATLRGTGRQTNPILIEEEETIVSLFGTYREGLTPPGKMQIGRSLEWGRWQKKKKGNSRAREFKDVRWDRLLGSSGCPCSISF